MEATVKGVTVNIGDTVTILTNKLKKNAVGRLYALSEQTEAKGTVISLTFQSGPHSTITWSGEAVCDIEIANTSGNEPRFTSRILEFSPDDVVV